MNNRYLKAVGCILLTCMLGMQTGCTTIGFLVGVGVGAAAIKKMD